MLDLLRIGTIESHQLLSIFTVMVGGAAGGIVGIYLPIPLVATLGVVYRSLWMQQSARVETVSDEETTAAAFAKASGSALS